MRRTLSAIFIVLSIVTAFAAFGVPVNTSWTYQGQLQRSGAAYNGTCNFQFSLWDAVSAGTQQGSTQSINSVNVANGLFTVVLDFGASSFLGDGRWLGTSVQCSGDGGFTPLDPRQPITATPYALSLRPGSAIIADTADRAGFTVQNNSPIGQGLAGYGYVGVYGSSFDPSGAGVYGSATETNSAGVYGINTTGAAIWGHSEGVGSAIYGENTSNGYAGQFVGPVSVERSADIGTTALDATGYVGVHGFTNSSGAGLWGSALGHGPNSIGIFGQNDSGAAIWGSSTGAGSAIYGQNTSTGWAGRFTGPVLVEGNMIVQGTLTKPAGSFKIDHPLDPANKFLSHSFVESPDMMNIYNGNVTTDETGAVVVALPDYFAALNRDFRYQLTVLGQFAQAIVSRKIAGNSFEIRTDKPGIEVSWQVTGIRQDAYARARPIVVEEFKPAEQQGMYLYPAGFGAGEEKLIGASSRPATPQTEQKITK